MGSSHYWVQVHCLAFTNWSMVWTDFQNLTALLTNTVEIQKTQNTTNIFDVISLRILILHKYLSCTFNLIECLLLTHLMSATCFNRCNKRLEKL